MATKRAILSELTRDELRDNLDFFELEVDDRRVTSQLIDALAGSRKARLDEILPYLSSSRSKGLCRAFDLDDSGRRKADLAVRLFGPGAGSKRRARLRHLRAAGATAAHGRHSPGACSSRPWRLASRTAAILYSSRLTNWRRQREAGALYQHEVPHGCR